MMKKGVLLFLLIAGSFCVSAQTTGKYQIKFLEINKQDSDYGVAILDDNKLVFTSAYEKVKNSRSYNPRKGLYVGDIRSDGEITNIKPIADKKDKKFNQTGATYSADGKTVYFSRSLYINKKRKQRLAKNKRLDLYKAIVGPNGTWSNIEKLPFNVDEYSTGFPVLNKDNSKLYFVSDRLPSLGGTDIFVVNISKKGKYGKPRNLGKNVNTSGNETTPFITEDDILYFSSDGHPGKGKLDVFAVEVFESATSEVIQLGSPINSMNDDFAYIINKEKNLGFFASNRLQGKDANDLYGFTLKKEEKAEDCYISVEGKVQDNESKEVIAGANVELFDLNGSLLESISTYTDGSYKFRVSCAKEYKIVASNEHYQQDVKHIEILEENYHSTLHTNLNLNKIVQKKEVIKTLQPIYYDFDDASITTVAAKEMDKIAKIMNENPELILEASAFTDSRGSDDYNRKLSQRRAKSALEYLVAQGIDKTRVRAKGYGEERLRNNCVNGVDCDEHIHQANRRTEFNFANIQASINKYKSTKQGDYVPVSRRRSFNKSLNTDKKTNQKNTQAKLVNTEQKEDKRKSNSPHELSKKPTDLAINNTKVSASKSNVKKEDTRSLKPESKKVTIVDSEKTPIKETPLISVQEQRSKTSKRRNDNLAENYIEEQKDLIIEGLSLLEQKYDQLIAKKSNTKLAIEERNVIIEYKKSILNLDQIGWSNIINYKIDLKRFKREYEKLLNEEKDDSGGSIIVADQNLDVINEKEKEKTKETKKTVADNNPVNKRKNLKVNNVQAVGIEITSKGNYSKTNHADKTDLIKVSFKLKKNSFVNKGNKEAHIVINTPNGEVRDATGVFKVKGLNSEKKFTDHTTIDFASNDVNVIMYIERKGENYVAGDYPIELFLEGELVAEYNLSLGNRDLVSTNFN